MYGIRHLCDNNEELCTEIEKKSQIYWKMYAELCGWIWVKQLWFLIIYI